MSTMTKSDILRHLLPGMKTEFMSGYEQYASLYTQYTQEIKSNQHSESYAWLGSTPKMKEFVDTLSKAGMTEYGFDATNKKYAAGIDIDVDALADNLYSQYLGLAKQMGYEAAKHKDDAHAIHLESNGLSYDGQNFFDTNHEENNSGVQSNLLNGAGFVLSVDAIKLILSAMRKFRDDQGRPVNIMPDTIMVPPALEFTAREIFDTRNETNLTKEEAVLKGRLNVIVNPYLTEAGTAANSAYYVMSTKGIKRPLIHQNRLEAEINWTDVNDSYTLNTDKVTFRCKTRFTPVYGDWRYAIRGGNI